ncbi:DUF554 domain-containing protein [Lachnospiraceae bacterium 46-61]
MIGFGTLINTAAIIIGGIIGLYCGKIMKERYQNTIMKATGICVIFIGIAGTIENMMTIQNGKIISNGTMMMITSIVIGSLIGEILDIELHIEQFGQWLKNKTGNTKDSSFVDAFVTASLTVCIGAMAIVGAIQDGIFGDYSILAIKAILDFIIILIMTSFMGKGCIFSAVPVGLLQGLITILAKSIQPFMTEQALHNISFVGSMLIFCVGINLIWEKTIKVANMLPSIIIAVLFAFIAI